MVDRFVVTQGIDEETARLSGVEDMGRLARGFEGVKLVYSKSRASVDVQEGVIFAHTCVQTKSYSGNISGSLPAKDILSFIRKWECHFRWEQHDHQRRRDARVAIEEGDEGYCGDYVHYEHWCGCKGHN